MTPRNMIEKEAWSSFGVSGYMSEDAIARHLHYMGGQVLLCGRTHAGGRATSRGACARDAGM